MIAKGPWIYENKKEHVNVIENPNFRVPYFDCSKAHFLELGRLM